MEENILENILSRLKRYIDYKGLSLAGFERSIGMSNASMSKSMKTGGTIGADKIEIILRKYPDINMLWLITGKGDMLNDQNSDVVNIASEPEPIYGRSDKIEKLQEKIITLQDQRLKDLTLITTLQEELTRLKNICKQS